MVRSQAKCSSPFISWIPQQPNLAGTRITPILQQRGSERSFTCPGSHMVKPGLEHRPLSPELLSQDHPPRRAGTRAEQRPDPHSAGG